MNGEDLLNRYRDLSRNLIVGLRFALPLRAKPALIVASVGQFVSLICCLWIVSIATDLIEIGIDAEFSPWGVLSYATQSYFWLATLTLIVLIERRPYEFLPLGVSMAGALIIISCVWIVASNIWWEINPDSYYERRHKLWIGFLIWEIVVFARVTASILRPAPHRAAIAVSLYAVSIYAITSFLPLRAVLIEPISNYRETKIDIETAYYAQANLLNQSLYLVSPQRPGVADLYYIGFGAYAGQDVFKREIEQATVLFEQQFNAIGHTIKLINNPATLHTVPLANTPNLAHSLRGLAALIDREEDIVVVFLSSHGAEDATIAVQFQNFAMNDLSAIRLRALLDRNKIKWRIVIVSACYSGSFIDALESPTTLVITAAAADRASFGCSHENDWTYFGRAFFAEALNKAGTFIGAFDLANELVTKREREEGKEASNPQISIGGEIQAYLNKNGL
ncbi:MAG: hypothetical protein ACI915_000230 [Gammaproteobacteria bacterium]